MRTIILIFSVIVFVLYLILSQFVYPLIAWFIDGYPFLISIIIGPIVLSLSTILTRTITKDKFIRRSILIPCFISILASIVIIAIRFEDYGYYKGYMTKEGGDFYNKLGIKIINNEGGYWYKGVDIHGNEVIVNFFNLGYNVDYAKNNYYNDETKFDFKIIYYSITDGSFLGKKEFSRYYDDDDEHESHYDLTESELGITLYDEISPWNPNKISASY